MTKLPKDTKKLTKREATKIIVDAVTKKELPVITESTDKDRTAFNDAIDKEELQGKLPIDKLVEIATHAGLLTEQTVEQRFAKFVKEIKLHEIIYDCMQSSLNVYCAEYNKKNPTHSLKLTIHLRPVRNKVNVPFAFKLVLEMRRLGTYTVLQEKYVAFSHVREIRDEAAWKYTIYGELFNAFMSMAATQLIITHDINTGNIKSTVPA